MKPASEIKSKKLDLPPANTLIPKNFTVLEKDEEHSKKPMLLKQWDDTDLWYKKDDKFLRPKAIVAMKLFTNDNGFGSDMKARVFANLWNDTL